MTITELKSISDACKSDKEFFAHPEVRRVWWKAMGQDEFTHDVDLCHIPNTECTFINQQWMCVKCMAVCCSVEDDSQDVFDWGQNHCPIASPIPGSPADAIEMLRVKVANGWFVPRDDGSGVGDRRVHLMFYGMSHSCYVLDTLSDRLIVFAKALGAVEIGG